MEMKQLDFTETFKDAITIGMKNAPSVIAAVALFLVTIWIPYINIGTFIAITLLPYYGARSLGGVINDALNNGRGVFIASLTSNQEGASLQTAIRQAGEYKGKTVAYGIASTAQKFNKGNDGMGSVGLIIGATIGQWINDSGVDPAKFTGPILSPGYGWQGAETRDLKTVFKGTKGNVLVTVSRSIATHGPDIAKLTEATASVARDIRQALTEAQNESADDAADGDVE